MSINNPMLPKINKMFDKFMNWVCLSTASPDHTLTQMHQNIPNRCIKMEKASPYIKNRYGYKPLYIAFYSMNKSSHEQRRIIHPSLINSASKYQEKQRNHRDLTGFREQSVRPHHANNVPYMMHKRKDGLHIHKSFSFKWPSKREK